MINSVSRFKSIYDLNKNDKSHGDRHLGMGACFHVIFLAIFLMVS